MKHYVRAVFLVVTGICVSASAFAQGGTTRVSASDKYLISAKAGGVGQTQGPVRVARVEGRDEVLLRGDQVEIGDKVETGANGMAEILLNPGSYLRLGGNASLEFKSTSLDDLQIGLNKGSAIFEVFATDKFRVNVITPKGDVALVDTGVYRIDVAADGSGTISVTDGLALVGSIVLTEVKAGRMAPIGHGSVKTAKFDRKKLDALAEWSKTRAKDISALTASLNNPNVRNALFRSFRGGRWNLYDSFGLWIYDQFGGWCFLPFGHGWQSPYGYGYGPGIGTYYPSAPPAITLHKTAKNTPTPEPTGSRGTKHTGPPPFATVEQQQQNRNGRGFIGSDDGGWNRGFDSGSNRSSGSSSSSSNQSTSVSSPTVSIPSVSIPSSKPIKP